MFAGMHREDVKAAIRKRYRSVAAFERALGLPAKSVTDVLRGYTSARVSKAIETAIQAPFQSESDASGGSTNSLLAHRLNGGEK